jgi:hypothetical protein
MAFELEGKIELIYDQQQVSEKFKKREFILDAGEEYNGVYYANPIRLQCVNDHCSKLDAVQVGQRVRVTFAHKGSKWEKDGKVNYITNLNCWKIEPLQAAVPVAAPVTQPQQMSNFNAQQNNYNSGGFQPSPETIDDLPF